MIYCSAESGNKNVRWNKTPVLSHPILAMQSRGPAARRAAAGLGGVWTLLAVPPQHCDPLTHTQGSSAALQPSLHLQRGFLSPPWAFGPSNTLILLCLSVQLLLRCSFLVLAVLVPIWASFQGIYLLSQENLFQCPMTHNDLVQKLL